MRRPRGQSDSASSDMKSNEAKAGSNDATLGEMQLLRELSHIAKEKGKNLFVCGANAVSRAMEKQSQPLQRPRLVIVCADAHAPTAHIRTACRKRSVSVLSLRSPHAALALGKAVGIKSALVVAIKRGPVGDEAAAVLERSATPTRTKL